MANTQTEFNNLPAEVKSYLVSMKAADINLEIFKKNKIDIKDFGRVVDIITSLFLKKIKAADLSAILAVELKLDTLTAKSLACDIVGARLLAVKDWLGGDLEALIKSWGGDPAEYTHYLIDQKQALPLEEEYFTEQLRPQPAFVFKPKLVSEINPALDPAKEKTDSLELFKNGLADLLHADEAENFIADYNLVLISLLNDDQQFRINLENALYTNAEKITAGSIKSADRESDPTIENWLKDFIRENGSEMFDRIALAKYLSSSDNVKRLDGKDKDAVRRLLELYRNLAFFPDSMGEASLEEWQIVPVKREESGKVTRTSPVGSVRPDLKTRLKPVLTAAAPTADELSAMENVLSQYGPGSLEHKAVKEEITRLKNKGARQVKKYN